MKAQLVNILTDILEGTHLFIVELNVKTTRIDVFLDGDNGVNISECAIVNHELHERLEAEGVDTGNYYIDVSSPGIDRPLQQLREYKKNIGRKLTIRDNHGKQLKGLLVYVDESRIVLKTGNTHKTKLESIGFLQIREALVVI